MTGASYVLFGEANKEALAWKEEMMEVAKNQGSLVMLDRLAECLKNLRDDDKRQELDNLREYISKRIAMTDYPYFLALSYNIGSGPTESFCGCLTKRLKGSGMDGSINELFGTPPDIELPDADPPQSIAKEDLLKDEWIKIIIKEL